MTEIIKLSDVKPDCRHFRGHIPCKPNKLHGVMCNDCSYYDKTDKKILIIKLGAAGDVIRTTPLLYPLKRQYPFAKIYWLTNSPELVPTGISEETKADEVLKYNLQNVSFIYATEFDVVINLDKDYEAISILSNVNAKEKIGFTIKDGYCYPAGKSAEHKYLTGIFDNVSIENKENYISEIFDICGYEFKGEKYILKADKKYDRDWALNESKLVVGLNTGCGERWTSRLWKNDYWIELIHKLTKNDIEVVLLGGPGEDEKNKMLNEATDAKYFGVYDLKTFINLMNKCDAVVTQVTMSMHIAIALEKKLILMNNIFNPNEFELYGNGEIVQPRKACHCFFQPVCVNKVYECMEFLMPDDVFDACLRQLAIEEIKA
ncbi:MAG: glycosyltransferase family 9 protein [Ignavibacteria bacterium]|nr:glycosyltransferase family 9 protein [Ignavibacteria bacterium]